MPRKKKEEPNEEKKADETEKDKAEVEVPEGINKTITAFCKAMSESNAEKVVEQMSTDSIKSLGTEIG